MTLKTFGVPQKYAACTVDIYGIKCDNPNCGWRDDTVAFDPEWWLEMPCPKCGASLFTVQDYKAMKITWRIFTVINIIMLPFLVVYSLFRRPETTSARIEMDGSGLLRFEKDPA